MPGKVGVVVQQTLVVRFCSRTGLVVHIVKLITESSLLKQEKRKLKKKKVLKTSFMNTLRRGENVGGH